MAQKESSNLPKTSDTIWTFWSFDFKRSVQVAIPSKSGIFLEMYKKMQDYLGNGYVWERAICVDESKLQPIENFLESHLTSKDFDTNSIYINPNAKVQQ